jgi:hypothetical protein
MVGAGGRWLTSADGAIWIARQGGPMERRDARTGELLTTVDVLDDGIGLPPQVGFGSVWKASTTAGTLTRVDAQTGAVQARISIPNGLDLGAFQAAWTPAVDETGIWVVAGGYPRTLVHVDAASNSVDRALPVPDPSAQYATYAFGSLWVNRTDGKVSRVNPADGTQLAVIEGTATLLGLSTVYAEVADDSALWGFVGMADGRVGVSRIDPTTSAVAATIPVSDKVVTGLPAGNIAVGGGSVWVATPNAMLVQIDPKANAVKARYGAGPAIGVTYVDGAAWVTRPASSTAVRIPVS